MSIIYDYEGVARALRKLQGKPEPLPEPDKADDWTITFIRRAWGTPSMPTPQQQEDDDA